jgi:hypothetical protein
MVPVGTTVVAVAEAASVVESWSGAVGTMAGDDDGTASEVGGVEEADDAAVEDELMAARDEPGNPDTRLLERGELRRK